MPEGRSAWVVAFLLVVFGSIGLSAAGLTALRAELPIWTASGTPATLVSAPASPDAVATPAPTRTPTPIPTQLSTLVSTPTAAAPQEVQYTVVLGDGLERIAEQFGVTADAVAERNDLVPPYRLEVGQVLLIPNGD